MANTGFGLRLVGRIGGGEPSVREYYVPSSDGTALYAGDVVELADTMDAATEVPVVTRATSGHILLGVVCGFRPDATLPYTGQYRAASLARYVLVCDDPYAIYEVQEDAVGGSITAAQIGGFQNFPMVVAAGSTVTGLSGTMLDSDAATESASDLKVIGVRRDASNPANVASTNGAIILVTLGTNASALALRSNESVT